MKLVEQAEDFITVDIATKAIVKGNYFDVLGLLNATRACA
jgi:hypothetical protein